MIDSLKNYNKTVLQKINICLKNTSCSQRIKNDQL